MPIANTTIRLRKSATPGNQPTNLANGEIAINYADGRIYYLNANGSIASISGGGSSSYSFSTINVNSSLVLATSPTDILTLAGANGITVTACTSSKVITIGTTGTVGIDTYARDTANGAASLAQAAFDKANTGGSVSSSGYLANSIIFANASGYLSNTNNLQFFTSNNNFVVTGNVIGGGVRTTSSASAPASPTPGDIWYKTTNDKIYRYTYDGSNSYWIDINTPIFASNGVVSIDSYARDTANAIIGVNLTQNTNITYATGLAQAAFDKANTGVSTSTDDYARTLANTATNNIVILQGVDTTQNTRISSVDNTANAAYAKANAAFDKANTGGSGSSSGYLANSVIFANTTGYLTNTSALQFFTSNNNFVVTGNVIGGGVRTTTSSTAPDSPTPGDIWYKTTNDKVYRYTYDGAGNYWIDINTPTVSSNAVSTTTSTNIIISTISITDNSYAILDDTAVSNSGGYIQIAGTNFSSNCSVIIGSNNTISTTVVNSSIIRAQVGAALPTSYHVYITDSGTGAVGIKPNGLTYSSFPVWGTGSTLTAVDANTLFSQTLSANSDSNIVYSNTSVLPTGTSLLANGYFYGNVSVGIQTTYNFDVKATDVEIQDTSRAFSLTVTPVNPYAATNWSWYFQDSGNNNDVVARTSPTSNATFNSVMNGSTVTKEAWVRRTAPNGVLAGMILSRDTGVLFIQGGTLRYYNSDTTGAIIQVSESYIPLNTWTHVAITHNSGTVTLWINGSSIATASGQTFSSSSIALGGDTDFRSIGYMSQIRISNIVRYTTTFSPPTLPFVSDANTYFLAGQSNSLTDNGVLGLTIVNTGTNPVTFSNSVVPFNL